MEIITVLALILNFITLIIVAVQTYYTKNSLNVALSSIILSKTSRQIYQLPRINFIIHVTNTLNRWNEELKMIIKYIEENKTSEIIELSKRDTIMPKGLIDEYLYEKMPTWLSVIYESGAQYYYNSSCLNNDLWNEEKKIIKKDYLNRFKESSDSLELLLKFIKDDVPEVFLNCPSSISTVNFFKK